MGPRLQAGLLAIALLAVAAFVISFATGLRATPDEPEPEPESLVDRIRVEVLNGAGRPGLARRATDRLVEEGFDVVFFGNAGQFGRDSSVVLDRRGDPERAQRVARALGIAHVDERLEPDLFLDATVILGQDWPPPPPPVPDWRDRAGSFRERFRGVLPWLGESSPRRHRGHEGTQR